MLILSTIGGAAQACAAPTVQAWVPDFIAENIGLLTPTLILLSAVAAAWGVISQRDTARRRATLDMIEKVESTDHYRSLHSVFSYHRRRGTLVDLSKSDESKDREDRKSVVDYLNHYELVAIGILEGTLDENIYKRWMHGPFVRDWNAASEFIQRERWKWDEYAQKWTYRSLVFEHYQKIANKWDPLSVQLDANYSHHPKEPEGPGDENLPTGNDE